jgi:hypothetical protein
VTRKNRKTPTSRRVAVVWKRALRIYAMPMKAMPMKRPIAA